MLGIKTDYSPADTMAIRGQLLYFLLHAFWVPWSGATEKETELCRDRNGLLPVNIYKLSTCASCYAYLFPVDKDLVPTRSLYLAYIPTEPVLNGSQQPEQVSLVLPDIHNKSSHDLICRTLNSHECNSWEACCLSAERCCDGQLKRESSVTSGYVLEPGDGYCPTTWDGYACWDETPPGITENKPCPSFISQAMTTDSAYKECTKNGTWYKDQGSQLEWTDYTKCLDFKHIKIDIYVSIGCNALSLVVLIPSTFIFLYYRTLRSQHRIRIHIQLFTSFILYGVINILWDVLVVWDRMSKPRSESRMQQNSIGCKLIYIMTRYSRSTNYLWMFVEACYLHRLIVKAFEPPKSLWSLYVLAWGFPWVPVTIYSVLRHLYADESCWVQHFGAWEWLIYAPNLISLAANLFFLVDILRILLTQLQSHPNEPSNYRRALKATFILVPLFGLQLFLIIYRPPGNRQYEIISSAVTNSQGFFVSLIFCLLNGEVRRLNYLAIMLLGNPPSYSQGQVLFGSSKDRRRRSTSTHAFWMSPSPRTGSADQNLVSRHDSLGSFLQANSQRQSLANNSARLSVTSQC